MGEGRYPRRRVRVDEHTITFDQSPVFYRSDDGHIREMRWSAGAGWVSADLTTQTSAANASANSNLTGYFFPSQQTRHVFYRSDDGHVRELWWGK